MSCAKKFLSSRYPILYCFHKSRLSEDEAPAQPVMYGNAQLSGAAMMIRLKDPINPYHRCNKKVDAPPTGFSQPTVPVRHIACHILLYSSEEGAAKMSFAYQSERAVRAARFAIE